MSSAVLTGAGKMDDDKAPDNGCDRGDHNQSDTADEGAHDFCGHNFQIDHAHETGVFYPEDHEQGEVATRVGQQQGGGHGTDDLAAHGKP